MLKSLTNLILFDFDVLSDLVKDRGIVDAIKMIDSINHHNEVYGDCLITDPESLKLTMSERTELFYRLAFLHAHGFLNVGVSRSTELVNFALPAEVSDSILFKVDPTGRPCVYLPIQLHEIAENLYHFVGLRQNSVCFGNQSLYKKVQNDYVVEFACSPDKVAQMRSVGEVAVGVYEDAEDSSTWRIIQSKKTLDNDVTSYSTEGEFRFLDNPATLSGRAFKSISDLDIVMTDDAGADLKNCNKPLPNDVDALTEYMMIYASTQNLTVEDAAKYITTYIAEGTAN